MKKLVGLILCIMLVFSFSTVAQTVETDLIKNKTLMDDDVPIWEIGDYWTLVVNEFLVQLNQSGQLIELSMIMDEFTLTVESETTTSYQLSVSGKMQGTFLYDDGAGTRLSGSFLFTRVTGSMQIRKVDLAAENEQIVIKSIALLTEHPFPFSFPIPLPLKITIDIEQTTPRPLIDFPLFDGKMGLLQETQISASIKVESIVLKILHIFNPEVPEEILFDQVMDVPILQYSASVEEVTVEAGIYTAYDIAFFEGLFGSVHYAPEAGNLIKVQAEMEIAGALLVRFQGELKETNFSP